MGNARSEYKKANLQSLIDRLAKEEKPYAEECFAFLYAVMRGEVRTKRRVREPGPDEDTVSCALIPWIEEGPTIKERMEAAREIIKYRNGAAPQSIDVFHSGEVRQVRDLSTMSDAELIDLERLLSKANTIEAIPVAASIIQDALPEGETEAEIIE